MLPQSTTDRIMQQAKNYAFAISGSKNFAPSMIQHDMNNYIAGATSEASRSAELINALKEITEGKGRYSQDIIQHLTNTIEDLIEIAEQALENYNK